MSDKKPTGRKFKFMCILKSGIHVCCCTVHENALKMPRNMINIIAFWTTEHKPL